MENTERIELNKLIRAYKGENGFLISIQKQLKSKYAKKIEVGKKSFKILTDKQYEVAKLVLEV